MNHPPTGSRRNAVLALFLACAFWGISFPITKALGSILRSAAAIESSWLSSALMIGGRFAVGAVVIALIDRTRPRRGEVLQGALLGLSTGVGMLLQTDALAYTEASTGAFLTQGYVVVLPLWGIWMTRRLPPPAVAGAAFLVLVGLSVLARFDPRTLSLGRGETETLLAALCFTVQILTLGSPRYSANRTLPVTWIMFSTMAVVTLPVLVHSGGGPADFAALAVTPTAFGCFVALTLLSTLGAFVLMNRFQRGVTPSEAGIIYATEPAFTSLFALFVPGLLAGLTGISYENEVLDARLLVGGGLVLLANVVLAVWSRPAQSQ